MDDDDVLGLTTQGTNVSMQYGDVGVSIESGVAWTPELIDHVLVRVRRQLVAAARQLGVAASEE